MSHHREECEHGIVVSQCKCASPSKTVRIVPCPPRCFVANHQEPERQECDSEPWDGIERESDTCSWPGCERTAEDEGWPTLIYIKVLTSPGEEGYAEVTQALCMSHADWVFYGLMGLNFASHNHHGTNPLVDHKTCSGYPDYACGKEYEYGPELVGR